MLDAYRSLLKKARDLMLLRSISDLMEWDFETKMPQGATNQRSIQMAIIEQLAHQKWIDPEIGTLLAKVKKSPEYEGFGAEDKRNVYLMQRSYDQQTKLPTELVEEIAKQSVVCTSTWKKAKAEKNYSIFKPELEKMVGLIKQKAHYLDADKDPYDVLVDLFEPGATAAIIARLFEPLKNGLIPLIKKCARSSNKPDLSFLKRSVPHDVQEKISQKLMEFEKYDLKRGRLDETEHPFTSGTYDDVRICTHYYDTNFSSSIFSVLHEAGHAIYEQNLPEKWYYQPVGSSCSLGIHESMSRFVENVIGRSKAFWVYFLPELKRITGKTFEDVDVDLIVRAVNDVKPSKIRIEADEVTYSLHVILRFEIEKDLMAENVTVSELPQLWNEKMDKFLGIEIENDSEGVMQDTHWAGGAIGYFPDYALGNIYDGMFIEAMEKAIPRWRDSIAAGDFSPVFTWLKENTYQKGNIMDAIDLVESVTRKKIDAQPFVKYVNEKMKSIFDL
jgi:carboxypeptidase Taq